MRAVARALNHTCIPYINYTQVAAKLLATVTKRVFPVQNNCAAIKRIISQYQMTLASAQQLLKAQNNDE